MDVLIYDKNILVELDDLFYRLNNNEITAQEESQLEKFFLKHKQNYVTVDVRTFKEFLKYVKQNKFRLLAFVRLFKR